MDIIQTIITVKADDALERAVASEVSDDANLTESYLNQISVQYGPTHVKKTTTVVENPDEQDKE